MAGDASKGGEHWDIHSASPKEALHLILGRESRAPRKRSPLQSRGGAGALFIESPGARSSLSHLLVGGTCFPPSPHPRSTQPGLKMGCASPRRFSQESVWAPPRGNPAYLPQSRSLPSKHRRDQSSPRLAFAARANNLRHRPTRAGTKLSLRGWFCQMTPRSLSGLENGFPSPSWTSSSQQGKIIGATHVGTRWVPGLWVKGCAESRGNDCLTAARRF